MKTPRIGCVKYLNARPLIHDWPGAVDFDHPSALCEKLARGNLDVALVSSIEYLRRPNYRIVDRVSISAEGPVYSVIVAHEQELSRMEEIGIDPASQTSSALLRCLLAHRRLHPRLRNTDLQSVRLLIGDQAIRFRKMHPEYRVWDLAEEWKNITALPFVFALWLVRPEVANAAEIAHRLRTLRDENLRRIDELIAQQSDFDAEFCGRYFRENLRFDFGEQEKAGLREFHRRCLACGIDVARAAELNFV
ncbi:MAG: menaquinone biosynthesis protein [Verrucomicrobiota bacterium]|nr:menaquinone biosynthesis protein [Verrucomicrobiota bacterium]